MTHYTTHPTPRPLTPTGAAKAAGAAIAGVVSGVWNFFITIAETNSRVKEVEHLNHLTDAELAKRGIKREDIVRHVFRDTFYL